MHSQTCTEARKRNADGTITDAHYERKKKVKLLLKDLSSDDIMWELLRRECDTSDDEEHGGATSLGTPTH